MVIRRISIFHDDFYGMQLLLTSFFFFFYVVRQVDRVHLVFQPSRQYHHRTAETSSLTTRRRIWCPLARRTPYNSGQATRCCTSWATPKRTVKTWVSRILILFENCLLNSPFNNLFIPVHFYFRLLT